MEKQYADLYRLGRHEMTRSDGLRVAFGNDHVCGVFVQVWNPANGNDCEDLLVDVDERFEGETVVREMYAEWVLGDVHA